MRKSGDMSASLVLHFYWVAVYYCSNFIPSHASWCTILGSWLSRCTNLLRDLLLRVGVLPTIFAYWCVWNLDAPRMEKCLQDKYAIWFPWDIIVETILNIIYSSKEKQLIKICFHFFRCRLWRLHHKSSMNYQGLNSNLLLFDR